MGKSDKIERNVKIQEFGGSEDEKKESERKRKKSKRGSNEKGERRKLEDQKDREVCGNLALLNSIHNQRA